MAKMYIRTCDYCGEQFDRRNRHGTRNKSHPDYPPSHVSSVFGRRGSGRTKAGTGVLTKCHELWAFGNHGNGCGITMAKEDPVL